MNTLRMKTLLGLLALLLAAAPAAAQCFIGGEITAAMNDGDPSLGLWCYTLEMSWDTDDQTALSHLDLLIDTPSGTCECEQVVDAIRFTDVAGTSDGVPDDCLVEYYAMVECNGDPSIPGVEGIIIKWEPSTMSDDCEPGPVGMGSFTFYSDFAPVPVDETLPILIEKNSGESCSGTITGVFPGLDCNPVSTSASTLSEVKGLYDR